MNCGVTTTFHDVDTAQMDTVNGTYLWLTHVSLCIVFCKWVFVYVRVYVCVCAHVHVSATLCACYLYIFIMLYFCFVAILYKNLLMGTHQSIKNHQGV